MELKDLIVTPILILVIYFVAYIIRSKVTDSNTHRYFIPALTVKIVGAIAIGVIYQFYYGGGDTFAFHTFGSKVIWEAFLDNPVTGFNLFINSEITEDGIYNYASRIWYYNDPQSFFVVQIGAICDLLTFGTYSGTAILFASFSFTGIWALYLTFYNKFRQHYMELALAILFVPTVFFWGSGLLKDTITIGCLGWMTFAFDRLFLQKKLNVFYVLLFVLSGWIIYSMKIYILLSFLPALILWFYLVKINQVRQLALRILIAPILLVIVIGLGYFSVKQVGEKHPKYRLEQLAETAKITAYDIRFGWGARRGEGSGYYLGELDGSFISMFKLMPSAINVSLFRPYLWEVKNLLMLLSAVESLAILIFTIWVIIKVHPWRMLKYMLKPEVAFCLTFSLIFAFAVGVSTFNFGTLSRYKIPLIPYYLSGLLFIFSYSQRSKIDRKFEIFESTE